MTAPDLPLRDEDSEEDDVPDLGLGRVAANASRGRFVNRDGTPTSRKYGLGAQRAERFYLAALDMPWPRFLWWNAGLLLLANGVFALAFRSLGPGALAGAESLGMDDPFLRALAFSVGVFTTVGTDGVHAVGTTANWLVILESLFGVLFLVVSAGLVIARLTRPQMRLRFSESMIVAPYENGRGVMFRMVNVRPGELADVRVRVSLVWFEDFGGVRERNFHQLELERDQIELFSLHWTVVHPIDERSPLRGLTADDIRRAEAEFIVAVEAYEETFATRVRQRTSYTCEELRWDVRFASIFTSTMDDGVAIDVERLSRTEPLTEGTTREPAPHEGPPAIRLV